MPLRHEADPQVRDNRNKIVLWGLPVSNTAAAKQGADVHGVRPSSKATLFDLQV